MASWLITKSQFTNQRWDYGYHAFQRMDFFSKWGEQVEFTNLGEIIQDDSYGILTPGDVYAPEHPITFLRASDMRRHLQLDFSEVLKVPEEYYRHKRARLKRNDILLAIKGASIASDKSVGFVDFEPENTIINGTVFRFQVKAKHNPFFVAVMLDSEILKGQIRNLQIPNNAVSYVDKPSIHALRIPTPSRKVQDQVADIMEAAYKFRSDRLNEAKILVSDVGQRLQDALGINASLIHHEKRFTLPLLELSPKWRVENNNLRGLKEALYSSPYNVVNIGQIGEFVTKRCKLKDTFKYIEIGSIDVNTGTIVVEKLPEYTPQTAPNNAQRLISRGDILISTRRPTRGAITVVPDELHGEVATLFFSIVRLRDSLQILPEYLCSFLRTPVSQLQIRAAITETTYPVISDTDVARFLLPLPPIEVQRQIVDETLRRRAEAKRLVEEAEQIVTQAKVRIEKMVLGAKEA